ncbi:Sugar transporter ERD6-like 6 [Diplonema papillatum]|nr:Sugar transporter ERD6-like 6 [Diplonema papillatum]
MYDEERHGLLNQPAIYEKPSLMLFVAVLTGTLVSFSFGYCLGFTSPVFNPAPPPGNVTDDYLHTYALDYEMNMNSDQQTWFGSVVNLGAAFGAILCGAPVDRFGKRFGMLAANICFGVGWGILLCCRAVRDDESNSGTMAVMYTARIICGFGIGFTCNSVGNYQTEISTLPLRGAIGNAFQVGVTVGLFTVYLLGLWLQYDFFFLFSFCPQYSRQNRRRSDRHHTMMW